MSGSPTDIPRGWRGWPWGWLALALAARIGILVWSGGYHPFGDPFDYDLQARSLVQFGHYLPSGFAEFGSPAALRPPAWPYWLAGVYEIFGQEFTPARASSVLLGVVAVWLVWAIAMRVADARIAFWAAGVAALAPPLVWMPSGLIAENLYVPLLLASVAVVLRFRDRPALWLALAAGLLLGASAMTRTNGLIVLLPLAAGVWLARRRWADIGILVAGVVIALTPWTVRNLAAFGDFAPLGTQTGVVLIGVFNEEARGSEFYGIFRPPEKVPEVAQYVHAPGHTETELDAKFRSKALGFALDHPGYTISITVRHALQLVELRNTLLTGGTSHREQSIPLGFARDTNRGGFLLLALLAIAGAVLARRLWWRRELLWFWSIPVLLFVSVVVVQGSPRYRLPIDPFLCLLAAAVPLSLLDRLRRRPSS